MNNKKLSIFISVLLFSCITILPFSIASAQNEYPKSYQTEVMKGINDARKKLNMKELIIDPDLCILAEKVAVDSEVAYPDKISNALNSDQKYKEYLENYTSYKSESKSTNDMLVEKIYKSGQSPEVIVDSVESLIYIYGNFEKENSDDLVARDSSITHACIGSSDGKQGYKPFSYFIGGVRKQSSWWDNFVNFFKGLFN